MVGQPLRLIIMSATLRLSSILSNPTLFSTPPPLIEIPIRAHPITIHFSRRTAPDYLDDVFKKVCKIHKKLPEGGILVFLTGMEEIMALCRKLEKRWTKVNVKTNKNVMLDRDEKIELLDAIPETDDLGIEGGRRDELTKDVMGQEDDDTFVEGEEMEIDIDGSEDENENDYLEEEEFDEANDGKFIYHYLYEPFSR
jgi:ATP-dependent RNA helicase DHX37/DHR1